MSKTSDRHELIAARAAIATPGPWVYGDDRDGRGDRLYRRENKYDPIADFEYTKDHDAEFIAHAREDIPWLLAALARSERKLTDQVARNDNLVNIATALNQDAFELQGDLDRAEQKLAEQAAIRIAALEEAAVIAAAGGSCWDMKLVQYRHLFPAEIAAAIRAAKEPTP